MFVRGIMSLRILLTLSSLILISVSLSAEEFAVATFTRGKVSFLSVSDSSKLWKTLKVNDILKPGDRIKTGNGSKVDFLYQETEIRIQPNTDFTLKEWNSDKKVAKAYVEKGAAWFRVSNFKKGSFEVSTPTTTAGVRGTAFGVFFEEKEKKGYTCVCEGLVNINGSDFAKGSGGALKMGATDLEKNDYKDIITKEGATIKFREKRKEMPMLSRCLPCHKPVGWEDTSFTPDETYGKK
ncbi:FecR family protein [Leptospira vanthielii]|uniref:Iron dicitrate transport regulator FecR n=2 Tax=Leptospira vanthielii TaxID=293085 RepID=A0ABY2NKZ4_9LEPT|nr:FecR domain-containing protein [Leptospira vanthielii]EMY71705.1 sigma factor regulatory protein, FecR/PupR family [Leptospira vanthielii serovar Holland str. Waz Holland = ATCC 700522]TGM46437.1 iron dicitrate transport regulator FecR [Leptospira vanthielii]